MHKTPQEVARIVADIAQGKMALQAIARYDWRAVYLPVEEAE